MFRNAINELRNRMEKGWIKEISDDIHAEIIQLIELFNSHKEMNMEQHVIVTEKLQEIMKLSNVDKNERNQM
jgi:hypothetical protein